MLTTPLVIGAAARVDGYFSGAILSGSPAPGAALSLQDKRRT